MVVRIQHGETYIYLAGEATEVDWVYPDGTKFPLLGFGPDYRIPKIIWDNLPQPRRGEGPTQIQICRRNDDTPCARVEVRRRKWSQ